MSPSPLRGVQQALAVSRLSRAVLLRNRFLPPPYIDFQHIGFFAPVLLRFFTTRQNNITLKSPSWLSPLAPLFARSLRDGRGFSPQTKRPRVPVRPSRFADLDRLCSFRVSTAGKCVFFLRHARPDHLVLPFCNVDRDGPPLSSHQVRLNLPHSARPRRWRVYSSVVARTLERYRFPGQRRSLPSCLSGVRDPFSGSALYFPYCLLSLELRDPPLALDVFSFPFSAVFAVRFLFASQLLSAPFIRTRKATLLGKRSPFGFYVPSSAGKPLLSFSRCISAAKVLLADTHV